jgi:hypothetical protein
MTKKKLKATAKTKTPKPNARKPRPKPKPKKLRPKQKPKKLSRRKAQKRKPKISYYEAAWTRRLEELRAFRREHGNCQVPSRSEEHPSLGHWVHYQRTLKRSGRLSAAHARRLERVGFDWVSRGRSLEFRDSAYWDKKWERMLRRLASFHRRFGHCLVPTDWPGTPSLGQWVQRQRHFKQQGFLRKERWQRLRTLGLDWQTGDSITPRWERCYLKLLDFRRRFGHCHVPAEWAEDLNLGRWVVKTRRMKHAGRLSADRVLKLNKVGFVWDAIGKRQIEHDALWSEWLAKLNAFHQRYGHWRVPTDQRKFHQLRVWMDNQRISYNRDWLSPERIRRLERIKFPWVSDRARLAAS